MSEIVMFVSAVSGAVWLGLGAVALLAVGFLVHDQQRLPAKKDAVDKAVRPEARRAA